MLRLPNHLRPRREKVDCNEPRTPLDREAKVRIMHQAGALEAQDREGKHYGALTGNLSTWCTRCCG